MGATKDHSPGLELFVSKLTGINDTKDVVRRQRDRP
jgi:hypothetical protein